MNRVFASAICAALMLTQLFAATAVLAQEPPPGTIIVRLEVSAQPDKIADRVAAELRSADGQAISNATVDFWLEVELLGTRNATLGSAVTDVAGVARVPITPRQETYRVRANFAGDGANGSTEAWGELRFPPDRVEPAVQEKERSSLATLRTTMPRVIGVVVAALWLLLIGFAWNTIRRIRRTSHLGVPDGASTVPPAAGGLE